MLYSFHDFFRFLELFQSQNNPPTNPSRENDSELTDVDRIVCWEMDYNMTPCREFVNSRAEAGFKKDSTRENDEYYEGRLVYRIWKN